MGAAGRNGAPAALEHGGRLRAAAARYRIPLGDWLDLSTGINPNSWPAPSPPPSLWGRLPEDDDGLEAAADAYYGCSALLPVAGSQAAIQALPRLRPPGRVAVLHPGYAEHAAAWRRAGHTVSLVSRDCLRNEATAADVLVLIHPGNPSGVRFARDELLAWQAGLAARGGWLVVDEAFMDPTPDESLAPLCPRPGLIVLRSLGKFFGLAGARVGFALAEPHLLAGLASILGPWTIATPARWLAEQALADRDWQYSARARLQANSERLAEGLTRSGLPPSGGCALFQWLETSAAAEIHEALAHQGVLIRRFTDPPSLRFGLPGDEASWARLEMALTPALHR